MKAIVALHFELGYPQELVAEMFDMKQPSLVDEIALIQRIILGKPYKPRSVKSSVRKEEIVRVMSLLGYTDTGEYL